MGIDRGQWEIGREEKLQRLPENIVDILS